MYQPQLESYPCSLSRNPAGDSGILISKPHGSLNLADIQKEDLKRDAINIHSLDTEWEYDDSNKVIVRAQNPADALNRIVYPFENALIIEPTAKKSYLSPWINLQWHIALDMVRTAKEIISTANPSTKSLNC